MENDGVKDKAEPDDLAGLESNTAINSVILDYYKKFGKKRDLEQFFSLSTAQSDIRDPTSLFWRRMKSHNDSSDSGGKKSESSTELCRISIKCSVPEPSGSEDEHTKAKSGAESPPIITEDVVPSTSQLSENESVKSDDDQSQKSVDATFDTSLNKPVSPTSSVTSQRKLEWDSLADVGYGNESDRKTSASSLSTLEKLVLKQQISNNESHSEVKLGEPTAQSTPVDENDTRKNKKDSTRKVTKIQKKDVDFVEISVPHSSQSHSQPISVNLTKHISFNMEKDGDITIDNVKNNVQVTPEKVTVETEMTPLLMQDKEIQTTLKSVEKSCTSSSPEPSKSLNKKYTPILINFNNLRRRNKQRKVKTARKKINRKSNKDSNKENNPVLEKSGDQVSEAESFEYMPGHIYNQNRIEQNRSSNTAGNKSSLESSGAFTTDSSKQSKYFTRDLEKSIDVLKVVLDQRGADSELKKRLIKEVVQRLLKSRYKDDESTTDFLSGLSFNSKKLGLRNNNYTTTSTSDNTADKPKSARPKKSILRTDKFDAHAVASTSQSVPNLSSVSTSAQPVTSKLSKPLTTSHTESDASSKEKSSTDPFAKTSSEELYQKYIDALRREEFYKKYLRDKEAFMKQKLVCSENSLKIPVPMSEKSKSRLKDLMADLTRNNYDDGSGDASKLESGVNANPVYGRSTSNVRKQRSHSVFTLESGTSDCNKNTSNKDKAKEAAQISAKLGQSSKLDHYYCCPHHSNNLRADENTKLSVKDSSVQVDITCPCVRKECPRHTGYTQVPDLARSKAGGIISENINENDKYACVSSKTDKKISDNILVYKYPQSAADMDEADLKKSDVYVQCPCMSNRDVSEAKCKTEIKSSQTDLQFNLLQQRQCCNETSYNVDNIVLDRTKGKQKILRPESIRCIQTEISINPRISDPSLTDVKKINDADCAKLVKEYQREVYKSNTENDATSVATINDPKFHTCSTSKDNHTPDINLKELPYTPIQIPGTGTGVYKIPIEGADMTLFVNIGPTDKTTHSFETTLKSAGTEQPKHKEKSTCISEECSKGVQSCSSEVFTQLMSIQPGTKPVYDLMVTEMRHIEARPTKKYEVRSLNSSPRKANVDNKKPFLRSNTDNDLMCNIIPRNDEIESQSSNQTKSINLEENIKIDDVRQISKPACVKNSLDLKPIKMQNKGRCCQDNSSTSGSLNEDYPKRDVIDNQPISSEEVMLVLNKEISSESSNETPQMSAAVEPNSYQLSLQGEFKGQGGCAGVRFKPETYPEKKERKRTITRSNTAEDLLYVTQKSKDFLETSRGLKCSVKCKEETIHDRRSEENNDKAKDYFEEGLHIGTYPKTKPFTLSHTDKMSSCNKNCEKKVTSRETPKDARKSSASLKATHTEQISSCNENCEKKVTSRETPKDATNTSDSLKASQSATSGKSKSTFGTCETSSNDENQSKSDDPILDIIQDITRRYSKSNIPKDKKKKCFKEIINLLTCLLDTDESSGHENACSKKTSSSESNDYSSNSKASKEQNQSTSASDKKQEDVDGCRSKTVKRDASPKRLVDKGTQQSTKIKSHKKCCTESSDFPASSDVPGTSSDSATCNILKRIKRECEKYHQRRCKCEQKCATSSSTSVNCEQCRRVHHCFCRPPKCKVFRTKSCADKFKKKFVAYNLIIQTSDSMISEEPVRERPCKPLQEVVVKVPPRKPHYERVTFNEMAAKIEKELPHCSCGCGRNHRSRPCHNESDNSREEYERTTQYTVRDYLEQNRPDFVEKASMRQNCLKMMSENRAYERATKRELLSMQLEQLSSSLNQDQLRRLAAELSLYRRRRKTGPKIISEREMKKHSEKIYKSLPEVAQKKEEMKKESMKKTNLLMASIFKKNLQKKTLRGSVNISNYSQVIKI